LILLFLLLGSATAPVLAASSRDQAQVEDPRPYEIPVIPEEAYDVDVPILAYHMVGPEALGPYFVSTEQFTAEMDALLAYGYQTISVQDFLNYRQGIGELPENPIIITFDDGYQAMYDIVRPILKERGMTATFFILTGYISNTEAGRFTNHNWDSSNPLAYHMTWNEVRTLSREGFEIGSHTINHLNLVDTDPVDIYHELSYSKKILESRLGKSVNILAYPYGLGGEMALTRKYLESIGYQAALEFGYEDIPANPSESDLFMLPRRTIKSDVTVSLNYENPWSFFMRRVDPNFPLPQFNFNSFEAFDDEGQPVTSLLPGDTVYLEATPRNDNNVPYDILASAVIRNDKNIIYDSNAQSPAEDIPKSADDIEAENEFRSRIHFKYTVPPNTPPGNYQIDLSIYDPYHVMEFYRQTYRSEIYIHPTLAFPPHVHSKEPLPQNKIQ
ncbi:MAG: polysaccharide deacetylase family protein, partial [Anaerolineaceae bacterium]|nr:polysaccharide deacetylase family protein [Anaerolineaceae bacterium]